jgi:hypothetical protein
MADTQLTESKTATPPQSTSFAQQAEEAPPGLIAEFWDFLVHNKSWWLTPIVVVLLIFALLLIFGGTAAAPFIYTVF